MAEVGKRHFILGTAGHIDHGKTALVKALTGVDTDRLKEEKERGLTIDIGFAHLGDSATIIDVPGHEKFIKNMVAGVSTIDLVLFVVAADDGVMPQTREHLDILNILRVRSGIIVISKADLADEEWLELVKEDVRELAKGTVLENADVMSVSAIENRGIGELRSKIDGALDALPPRHDRGVFWMPVDRSFSMHGFGTVVTGSILSGGVGVGDSVELLPQQKTARLRGLQKHSSSAERAATGDRAALNLQGIARDDVNRGDVVTLPGTFKPTRRVHGKLRLLPDARELKKNTRLRLHLGTAEVMARATPIAVDRLAPGESGYVQFTLERESAARRLDPFVIRQYSPQRTLGGGVVLDADAKPYRRRDKTLLPRLQGLEKENPEELLTEQCMVAPDGMLTAADLVTRTGMAAEQVQPLVAKMQESGELQAVSKKSFIHRTRLEQLQETVTSLLREFHDSAPALPGLRKAELPQRLRVRVPAPLQQFVLARLAAAGAIRDEAGLLALADHKITLRPELETAKPKLAKLLYDQGYAPSPISEQAAKLQLSDADVQTLLGVLLAERTVIRFEGDIFMHAERVAEAEAALVAYLKKSGEITVPQFKELVQGVSRKFALPLLNYFDGREITLREGDIRYPGAAVD